MVKWLGETMISLYIFISVMLVGIGMEFLKFPFWSFLLVSVLLYSLTVYISFAEKLCYKRSLSLIPLAFFWFFKSVLQDFTQFSSWLCYIIPIGAILVLLVGKLILGYYKDKKNMVGDATLV